MRNELIKGYHEYRKFYLKCVRAGLEGIPALSIKEYERYTGTDPVFIVQHQIALKYGDLAN